MRFLILFLTNLISAHDLSHVSDFYVGYFSSKNIKLVTAVVCRGKDSALLFSRFSKEGILLNIINPINVDETSVKSLFISKYFKMGVLLDMKCNNSYNIMNMVNNNHLFRLTKTITHWLIILKNRLPYETIKKAVNSYEPEIDDPIKYLTDPYEDSQNSDLMLKINRNVNADFFRMHENATKPNSREPNRNNDSVLDQFFLLDLLPDNEATLAFPGPKKSDILFDLFDIYKVTAKTKVEMNKIASVILENGKCKWVFDQNFLSPTLKRRNNFKGVLLRGASAILHPHEFTTMEDLLKSHIDVWTKMTYGLIQLLAQDLNFRVIVRFFDDYGWERDGKFNGLMAHLQQRKTDLTATAMLLRKDRYPLIDYMNSPYRLQVGILFRQPSLSSVSNIFLLPFSLTVWLSIGGLIIIVSTALWFHRNYSKNLEPLNQRLSCSDIVQYIFGAICQQGYFVTPASLSARIIVIFWLLGSLALFTSFSANIVALLQSQSSSIKSLQDITDSKMHAGIQAEFPLFKVYFKETSHEVAREFYYRKIVINKDKAFLKPEEGIEKVKKGMFAYQVELSVGYKIISETYEEREKCGLKELDLFSKPFMGMAVPKSSPYKELFARRLCWQTEIGITSRTWRRWVPQKPTCQNGRTGFLSVGLTEFRPAIMVLLYGMIMAFGFFILEHLFHSCRKCFRHSFKI